MRSPPSARQQSARQQSARQQSARQQSARQQSARQQSARQQAAGSCCSEALEGSGVATEIRRPTYRHSDTTGMVRTMEMILGLAPISSYDANARPLAEAFTTSPDMTPFDALALGAGVQPSAAALARAQALARAADHTGPDRVNPGTQMDYSYLSTLGITAKQFRQRLGAH